MSKPIRSTKITTKNEIENINALLTSTKPLNDYVRNAVEQYMNEQHVEELNKNTL